MHNLINKSSNEAKISRSLKLIHTSFEKPYTIEELAIKVGYENASQFSKEFKKYFAYPPKEAKDSLREYFL